MADKTDIIDYTPEELSEIERITGKLPGSDSAAEPAPSPVRPAPAEDAFEPDVPDFPDLGDSASAEEDDFSSFKIPSEDEDLSAFSGSDSEPEEEEITDITGMI
ncbi:MAG: hypothetical protein ACRCUT_09815, partial [Spirochaetota bacterium]